MKFTGVVLLCCALLVTGQDVSEPPTGDNSTTTAATTTSTSSTTTKTTTTTEPTTTAPPETTTTPSPRTTTVKPTPSPTPSPVVPDYPKNSGKWSVEDDKNSSCITLKGAMQITVITENTTELLNVPPLAVASGDCSSPQKITLTWSSPTTPDKLNSLSLSFQSNSSKENSLEADTGITVGKYGLQNVDAILYLNSTNATEIHLKNIDVFQTPLNHSYSCLAEEAVKASDGKFILKIREVQLEAFRNSPPGHREFSAAVQCPADDATDVVPIAVGAALAGLVVIVLIAYLIGRKRSRARGYQSV